MVVLWPYQASIELLSAGDRADAWADCSLMPVRFWLAELRASGPPTRSSRPLLYGIGLVWSAVLECGCGYFMPHR